MNANGTRHVVVEPDGTGVVAHLELHALGSFADRLGLGDSPSARIPMTGERLPIHDRGKVFAQLPTSIASGHRAGDDSALTNRSLVVRADSAGCTKGFLSACRARNVRFFVTARSNPQVTAAIGDAIGIDQVWEPSRTQQGELREGSWVNARPKTLRWGIFHAPGRLIHRSGQHVVRIVE